MRIGSLFSGIGGLELGLERAGVGHVVWQVENNPFCRGVLARQWPLANRNVHDVSIASASNLAPVDVICGGFPCQDLSVAGRGEGLAGARSGLWYEFARVVDECQPGYVVVENVAQGRGRWLPYVRRDLETLGYRTRAYVLAASQVGAPHERLRCFVVADTHREPLREWAEREPARRTRRVRERQEGEPLDARPPWLLARSSDWQAPPVIPRVDDGLPDWVDREHALGNAVVPAVAELVGRILLGTA